MSYTDLREVAAQVGREALLTHNLRIGKWPYPPDLPDHAEFLAAVDRIFITTGALWPGEVTGALGSPVFRLSVMGVFFAWAESTVRDARDQTHEVQASVVLVPPEFFEGYSEDIYTSSPAWMSGPLHRRGWTADWDLTRGCVALSWDMLRNTWTEHCPSTTL